MIDGPIEFDKWLQFRCGRFTASEKHKLFSSGTRKMTEEELKEAKENKNRRTTVDVLFGDGAMTYIYEKASERLTMVVKPEIDARPTNWGKEHEWDACQAFLAKGYKGTYYGANDPKFFEVGEYLGFSPDFLNEKEKYGADFKCPYNSSEHLKNIMLRTQEDFKDLRWEYYCQIQDTMMKANLEKYYFVSYDPRYIEDRLKLKVLEILRDNDWIDECHTREQAAIELLDRIIKSI